MRAENQLNPFIHFDETATCDWRADRRTHGHKYIRASTAQNREHEDDSTAAQWSSTWVSDSVHNAEDSLCASGCVTRERRSARRRCAFFIAASRDTLHYSRRYRRRASTPYSRITITLAYVPRVYFPFSLCSPSLDFSAGLHRPSCSIGDRSRCTSRSADVIDLWFLILLARRNASAVLVVAPCLPVSVSVCHKPVMCRNG